MEIESIAQIQNIDESENQCNYKNNTISIETRMNKWKARCDGLLPDDDSDPQIFELRPTDHRQELPSPFGLIFSDIVKCFDT